MKKLLKSTMESSMSEPTPLEISDEELLDKLKHQAAMWFNNYNLLLLDELFLRFNNAKRRLKSQDNPRQIPSDQD